MYRCIQQCISSESDLNSLSTCHVLLLCIAPHSSLLIYLVVYLSIIIVIWPSHSFAFLHIISIFVRFLLFFFWQLKNLNWFFSFLHSLLLLSTYANSRRYWMWNVSVLSLCWWWSHEVNEPYFSFFNVKWL